MVFSQFSSAPLILASWVCLLPLYSFCLFVIFSCFASAHCHFQTRQRLPTCITNKFVYSTTLYSVTSAPSFCYGVLTVLFGYAHFSVLRLSSHVVMFLLICRIFEFPVLLRLHFLPFPDSPSTFDLHYDLSKPRSFWPCLWYVGYRDWLTFSWRATSLLVTS
jgi:hypothetical protein